MAASASFASLAAAMALPFHCKLSSFDILSDAMSHQICRTYVAEGRVGFVSAHTYVTRLGGLPKSLNDKSRSPFKDYFQLHAKASLGESMELAEPKFTRREKLLGAVISAALSGFVIEVRAEAVSTSKRALKGEKVPESDYKILPNGLKYYDIKVGGGAIASKGSRVAVHYVVKWRGVTFMTSRQGMGVTGGTPYGFDVGTSEQGLVLRGLDYGVQGMRVGGQRLLIVPPQLAYGSKGIGEIPPDATLEMNVELLSIKQSPFGSPVKIVEG